ncbi:cytochrome P450 [Phenylobacterium sp. LjRoot225]|uniref:cytochrome P450 n=1 Tax=Phenylobacterium sp. LjRoot225 TaxID=3342285 RepID=UPI003ED0D4AB
MNGVGLSPPAPQPGHVPDAAVYDFDMFLDPGLLKDPHERVRQILGEAPPVFWTPRNHGHWVAMSHDAVFEVARDWQRFSSESAPREHQAAMLRMLPPGAPHVPRVRPISLDPPDHGKYRAALAAAFGPKAIKARTEEIRALAARLIEAVADQRRCDFVAAVAEPLPVLVFLRMMGLPGERLADFRVLVHKLLAPGVLDPMESARRMRNIADALGEAIRARRDDPRDDLISLLWATEIDGEPMTMEIMEDFCVLLFIAGLDTVINAIGHAVRHMAADPDLQARLRADPSLIPEAVEEMLRRYSFVTLVRRATEDMEFGGWLLKRNDRVMFSLAGAGLDPGHWNTPEAFDLTRDDKAHIAFGAGVHRCLGSHLARLELQVLYAELLQRLPAFRLDPEQPIGFRGGNVLAVETLPIRWD